MTTTHTPGPWTAAPDPSGIVIEPVDHRPCSYVAFVESRGGGTVEMREANARLIASAPELLEACKAALVRLDNLLDADTGAHSPAYLQIRAAIAAATGEQP